MPALEGVDVVFHCATPSPLGGNRQVFVEVNVEGTKTVIAACKAAGVKVRFFFPLIVKRFKLVKRSRKQPYKLSILYICI